jgi:hypothetical protein
VIDQVDLGRGEYRKAPFGDVDRNHGVKLLSFLPPNLTGEEDFPKLMARALRLLLGRYEAEPTSCCPFTRGIAAGGFI